MPYNEPSPLEVKVLTRRFGLPASAAIDTYLATDGYAALRKALVCFLVFAMFWVTQVSVLIAFTNHSWSPLTMRVMPSLIRATLKLMSSPRCLPDSFR